jgi:hypothetical protein
MTAATTHCKTEISAKSNVAHRMNTSTKSARVKIVSKGRNRHMLHQYLSKVRVLRGKGFTSSLHGRYSVQMVKRRDSFIVFGLQFIITRFHTHFSSMRKMITRKYIPSPVST